MKILFMLLLSCFLGCTVEKPEVKRTVFILVDIKPTMRENKKTGKMDKIAMLTWRDEDNEEYIEFRYYPIEELGTRVLSFKKQ